jgi:hypothetical protein
MTGRPRLDRVREELRHCSIHGMVDHREHKKGRYPDGRQRYQWICTLCHAATQLALYHRRKENG